MSTDRKAHWEHVYSTKAVDAVSWFQEHAVRSLDLIRATGVAPDAAIIDVGGGASRLVDDLLAAGYRNLTVLDLSAAALAAAQQRLGSVAKKVQWIEADVTRAALPAHHFDVWHDRAVFHFLTAPEDRAAYVRAVRDSLRPDGHVIIATFAEDGPTKCSGLPVMRYSPQALLAEFGPTFDLLRHDKEAHRTPSGAIQQFNYCHLRLVGRK